MVTTSTESCVSARSGAENQAKIGAMISPTAPVSTSATTRLPCRKTVASAMTSNTAQMTAKLGSTGSRARVPGAWVPPRNAHSDTPPIASTATAIARESEPLCSARVSAPARAARGSTRPSKMRLASGRGAASHMARSRGQAPSSTRPPPMAASDIHSATASSPCQW